MSLKTASLNSSINLKDAVRFGINYTVSKGVVKVLAF